MKTFEVDAIVEIPQGAFYKYEVDKKTGQLVVDRPLSKVIPYNYGYVPHTLHGDGDPLDVCIVGGWPVVPLARVRVVLIGALVCDDNGESDDKLLSHIVGQEWGFCWDGDDEVASKEYWIEEVKKYLSSYKEGFTVKSFVGAEEAYAILMKDLQAYQDE